jgi:glycosyltransferase involved in cell wall biosynthesis
MQVASNGRMKIGINLLYLIPGVVGGTGTYASGLLHGLAAIDHENEYVVFVNREAATLPLPEEDNFRRVVCNIRAQNRMHRYAYEQFVLPVIVRRERLDLLHSLGYVGPLFLSCRHVVTIHDLNYRAFGKQAMSLARRQVLSFFVSQSARRSSHIITDSHFSQHELVEALHISSDRISVTYLAPKAVGRAPPSPERRSAIRARYGISEPYVAVFGSLSPHKNIPCLIKALAQLKPDLPHKLLLIGNLPSEYDLVKEAHTHGLDDDIIVTGYIDDVDVSSLLSGADLFVFPSLYEGFGLPVLEAQQCGIPVACSEVASLPEVAGDAAVYFDPYSAKDIADKILKVLQDRDLQQHLVERGSKNLERFSWEESARDTLRVYNEVANLN